MVSSVWGDRETQFFYELDPHRILSTLDKLGFQTSGGILTLNSLENRVYEVQIEGSSPVIAKFYRPGRWGKAQILDEHQFLKDLDEAEVPVVAPLEREGQTLFDIDDLGIFLAIFPKKAGRHEIELNDDQLEILGRTLARLHNVGDQRQAMARLPLTPETLGKHNLDFILANRLIPTHLESNYQKTVDRLLSLMKPLFSGISTGRIHGDCHRGNILWRDDQPLLVDFDDMMVGPRVQDLWPLLPPPEQLVEWDIVLDAYEQMREFDRRELKLIEPLRALRLIHFSAWIGKRIEDPTFRYHFDNYGSEEYWTEQIRDLQFQIHRIEGGK